MPLLPQAQLAPNNLDIPATAATISTASTLTANVGNYTFTALAELAKSVTAGVTNMYVINSALPMQITNKVLSMQLANKDTRFENLVYAITNGYASSGRNFNDDKEFAVRACELARAIAYKMDEYGSPS